MTIRNNVNIRAMNESLNNMAAKDAPDGTYEFAKKFNEEFDGAFSDFFKDLGTRMATLGLKISGCDSFREIETLTYDMIKTENYALVFAEAEGFGESVQDLSPGHSGKSVRDNVLDGLIRDRDFLRNMNKVS
jgi:hypothetical protein